MKRSNEQSIGEVIKEFLKTYHLNKKIDDTRIIHSWEGVVGKMIARHTKNLSIRNGILFVKLDSPALKHELSFARGKIILALNKEAGTEVVKDIRFT